MLQRYSGLHLCEEHFVESVDKRVQQEFKRQVELRGAAVLGLAVSGGKDSIAMLHALHRFLGRRRSTELKVVTVDEGIEGYRPDSIPIVEEACRSLGLELSVSKVESLAGAPVDAIAAMPRGASTCSYCGVLRRRAMNSAAREAGADYLCVGLNADDFAQTILMNVTRGDLGQMLRMAPHVRGDRHRTSGLVPRLAPMRMVPENETLLYCMVQGIKWHDGTCPHFAQAQRNEARRIVHEMEERHPGTRFAMIAFLDRVKEAVGEGGGAGPRWGECQRCGEPSATDACKVCAMIDEIKEKTAAAPLPGPA